MTLDGVQAIDVRRTRSRPPRRIRPRGIPPGLTRHLDFTTRVVREAEQLGADLLGEHRIRVRGTDASDFEAARHSVRLGGISFVYVDFNTEVQLDATLPDDRHLVLMPTNGVAHIRMSGSTVEASTIVAACLAPGDTVSMRWSDDAPHLVIAVDVDTLERYLARHLGRAPRLPLVFEPAMDLTSPENSRWHAAIQLLHSEIDTPGSLTSRGHGIEALEEFVVSSLLLGQPSTYHSLLLGRQEPTAANRHVLKAIEYMESHLRESLGIADIAAAVGLGPRALQTAFRTALDTTPMNHLRELRLERARRDLLAADPTTQSVSDIASSWGFTHLGRFSAAYRARFGERPSTTLRS